MIEVNGFTREASDIRGAIQTLLTATIMLSDRAIKYYLNWAAQGDVR